jgi:hypothetical protein
MILVLVCACVGGGVGVWGGVERVAMKWLGVGLGGGMRGLVGG